MRLLLLIIISSLLLFYSCNNGGSHTSHVIAKKDTSKPVKGIAIFAEDSAGIPKYWKVDFVYRIVIDTSILTRDTLQFDTKDSSEGNIKFRKKLVHDTAYYKPKTIMDSVNHVALKAKDGKDSSHLVWIPLRFDWVMRNTDDVDSFIIKNKLKQMPDKK